MFEAERAQVVVRIAELDARNRRLMIAVAGPPAAGKSTLAELLVNDLNNISSGTASLVPMDGYHLDNAILDARDLRERKGAPETFDADAFVTLVGQIATKPGAITYPTFDRSLDRAVPDSGSVSADTKIVVVEGNYLLLTDAPWNALEAHFDLTVFVSPDLPTLETRLIQRWLDHGFDKDDALKKAQGNDIPNAKYVLEHSRVADLAFDGD